jgi:hypothetical protein
MVLFLALRRRGAIEILDTKKARATVWSLAPSSHEPSCSSDPAGADFALVRYYSMTVRRSHLKRKAPATRTTRRVLQLATRDNSADAARPPDPPSPHTGMRCVGAHTTVESGIQFAELQLHADERSHLSVRSAVLGRH